MKRSVMGEMMAELIRPTTMRMPPAMPASVSLKSYGERIWLSSEETLLKKPT